MATLLGIGSGCGLALIAVLWGEGWAGLRPFINVEAILVVMGGTLSALLVNYPLSQVLGLSKVLKKVLLTTGEDVSEIISTFLHLSQRSREFGPLALQAELPDLRNDFLKRGIQLVIDGGTPEFVQRMMETELGFIYERHKIGQEIFNALGTYSPAFGMIGTVLGMILILNTTTNVEDVPRQMALCLSAAFFGLGSAYLIFLPMAGKLRRRSEEEILIKEIIIRGVLLVQSGVNPWILETNLTAYLAPSSRDRRAPALVP